MLEKLMLMALGSIGGLVYQYYLYKDLSNNISEDKETIIENPTSSGNQP